MSAEFFEAPSLELLSALLPAYEFEAFVAQGGMGAVYKASQRSLDRDVAIKILPREFGSDPEFRKSFEKEAKAMARLNHPNLIAVYDFGDVDGMPYIVMEFVNGKSLFHSAYNLAVDPVQAVTIVKGICDGLAHAHEHGIIHRDIKPANILLTPKAEPKIGDFGLARPAGADDSGILMGTPGYAAPEITRQPDHADRRSDIFALGVVLYELLIGRCPPYDGHLPPPSTVCGCDPALDRICTKAMNPVADLRYSSAEEMSEALDTWLRRGHAVSPHAPVRPPGGRPAPVATGPRPVPSAEPVYLPAARGETASTVKWLVLMAVAIVISALGWKQLRKMEQEKADAELAYQQSKGKTVVIPSPPKPEVENPWKTDKEDGEEKAGTTPDMAGDSAAGDDPGKTPPASPDPAAALATLLRTTGESLAAGEPEFPPGTVEYEGNHVFIAAHAATRAEAAVFARQAGGRLIELDTAEKDDWLAAKLVSVAGPEGFWIGAERDDAGWKWSSGEPWDFTRWQDDTQADGGGGFAKIVPGEGWQNDYPDTPASGFVVEWPAAEPEDDSKLLPPEIAELEAKAKDLLAGLGKERQKDLAANAKTFQWDLDNWLKDLSKNENANWKRDVNLLKALVKDNRVPAKVDAGNGIRLSPQMSKVATHCARKQEAIDLVFDTKAAKIRDAYVARLAEEAKKAAGPVKKAIERHAEAAADLEGWIAGMGFQGAQASPAAAPFKIVSASYGTRGKFADVTEKVREFLITRRQPFHANPGSLGVDPDPGWNKGLTVKYEVNGVPKEKSWGENSRVGPEDFIPQGGDSGASAAGDPVIGRWILNKVVTFVAKPDGTASNEINGWQGTWKFTANGAGGRAYEMSWKDGAYVDSVTLSRTGDQLSGANQHGDKFSAERVKSAADPLVGAWLWDNTKNLYFFREDGTVSNRSDSGKWKLVSEALGKRVYAVAWDSGSIDNLVISADSDSFEGANDNGTTVSGRRVGQ